MKSLPKISIVVPSYNKVDYIGKTLQSIVDQKYSNLEVMIRDGGSTDGTLDVIKEYTKRYPRIFSYVSKKDGGQLNAINIGIKKTTGEILAFINADDVYEMDAFEKVAKAYVEHPNVMWLAGKGMVINEGGHKIASYVTAYKNALLNANNYQLLLLVNYLIQPSVFLTRSGYENIGRFLGTEGIVMEYQAWLRLGRRKMPLIINDNLSRFRMSRRNFSSLAFEMILKKDQEIVGEFTNNKFILFVHKIHNYLRKCVVQSLGK